MQYAAGVPIPLQWLPFSFSNTESRAVSGIDFGSAVSFGSPLRPVVHRSVTPLGQKAWKTYVGFTITENCFDVKKHHRGSQLPKVWMVQSFVETAKPHEVLDAMRVVSFCRVYIQTLQESIDVW